MSPEAQGDALAAALAERDATAIAGMDPALASLPQSRFPLRPENLVGLEALRRMASSEPVTDRPVRARGSLPTLPRLARLVDELERPGKGLIMTMGKGGVGKTTIAAAVAVELAARGHEVLLTTTDPAAHLSQTLAAKCPNLTVSRIDPAVETARYRDHVLASKGADLDAAGRAMLEEDLRSPCTEEIAVFQAFSKVIRESSRHFVVMDTAPTGHTLLLLDATGSYHRDIVRHAAEGAGIVTPMMRLQDPDRTRILIVTLPETTPVLEAARLQEDLRRAGIEPWALGGQREPRRHGHPPPAACSPSGDGTDRDRIGPRRSLGAVRGRADARRGTGGAGTPARAGGRRARDGLTAAREGPAPCPIHQEAPILPGPLPDGRDIRGHSAGACTGLDRLLDSLSISRSLSGWS